MEAYFTTANDAHNTAGDPVDTFNGNFTHNEPLFSLPVQGGSLDFQLSYISQATEMYSTTLGYERTYVYTAPLGYGWTHNHAVELTFPYVTGTVVGPIELQGHGGSKMFFGDDGDGTFSPAPDVQATMECLTGANVYRGC